MRRYRIYKYLVDICNVLLIVTADTWDFPWDYHCNCHLKLTPGTIDSWLNIYILYRCTWLLFINQHCPTIMKSVAIVGSGVAGLGAAWMLSQDQRKEFEVTLFEGEDYFGGHSHTVDVNSTTNGSTKDSAKDSKRYLLWSDEIFESCYALILRFNAFNTRPINSYLPYKHPCRYWIYCFQWEDGIYRIGRFVISHRDSLLWYSMILRSLLPLPSPPPPRHSTQTSSSSSISWAWNTWTRTCRLQCRGIRESLSGLGKIWYHKRRGIVYLLTRFVEPSRTLNLTLTLVSFKISAYLSLTFPWHFPFIFPPLLFL